MTMLFLPNALYENVKAINQYSADMLLSDEITLDGQLKSTLYSSTLKLTTPRSFKRGKLYNSFLVLTKNCLGKSRSEGKKPEY